MLTNLQKFNAFLATQTKVKVKVSQLCLTLCNLTEYTVHGILQARILEWVAFPFSRGSFQPRIEPRSPALQADSLPAEPQGKPYESMPHLIQECRWAKKKWDTFVFTNLWLSFSIFFCYKCRLQITVALPTTPVTFSKWKPWILHIVLWWLSILWHVIHAHC